MVNTEIVNNFDWSENDNPIQNPTVDIFASLAAKDGPYFSPRFYDGESYGVRNHISKSVVDY